VREDAIDLYGFSNQDDLAFFKQLIGVSGIGPKSALGIMNVADSKTLKRSIAQGDNSMLTKVFGIGKKSAERIVVELRDKLAEEHSKRGESLGGGDGEVMEEEDSSAETVEAAFWRLVSARTMGVERLKLKGWFVL
jgi:Holliday junction DNA helicase RuvA